jgi:hypothetical protein
VVHKAFTEMGIAEKVDFLVHCQKLLVEFHPTSAFVCREDNLRDRMRQMKAWASRYQGMCYFNDTVGVLYNRIVVADPTEPERAIQHHEYRAPSPDYNAILIDFAAFRDIKDCMSFVRDNYDPRIGHVLFVRHNKVKIYPVVDIISQIFKMPVV